jgi:hypothetical protein
MIAPPLESRPKANHPILSNWLKRATRPVFCLALTFAKRYEFAIAWHIAETKAQAAAAVLSRATFFIAA